MSSRPFLVAFLLFAFSSGIAVRAQDRDAEFRKLASQLAQQRLDAAEEKEATQEKALSILDGLVLDTVSSIAAVNLDALNQRLAALVTQQPPVGEGYQVLALRSDQFAVPIYLLAANFGLSGPSAVRIYAADGAEPPRYHLAARIDRFKYTDFFDEFLELLPVAPAAGVFVTATGRTDDLKTGSFTAWRFQRERFEVLWSSDLLQQSSYEISGAEFRLTYCAEPDDEHPRVCHKMVRDRYTWSGAWIRLEQAEVPVAKP